MIKLAWAEIELVEEQDIIIKIKGSDIKYALARMFFYAKNTIWHGYFLGFVNLVLCIVFFIYSLNLTNMKKLLRLHLISLIIVLLIGGSAFGQGAGKGEYIVGTGGFTATDVPVYPWYGYSYTQSIYLQSELDFTGQMIEQIGYQYAGTSANLELEIEIWLEHYSQSSITSTVQLTNATKVYDWPWNLSAGEDWSMITIDPFVYNNSDNLLLTIIEKKPGIVWKV